MEIDKQMSINIDEDLFHNVILNITSNCIRYAKKQVFIRGYVMEGKNVIEIYDDGDGTIEKNIPYLFERFYKGESNGKHEWKYNCNTKWRKQNSGKL